MKPHPKRHPISAGRAIADMPAEGREVRAIAAEAIHRFDVEEQLRRSYDTETAVNSLLRLSLEDLSLQDILKRALEIVLSIRWLAFGGGAILLVEDEPDVLVMKVHSGLPQTIVESCARLPFGRCVCGEVAQSGQVSVGGHGDHPVEDPCRSIAPHDHYGVPITLGGQVLGVINVHVQVGHRGVPAEIEFLKAVANTIAGIVARKRVEEAVRRETELSGKLVESSLDGILAFDCDCRYTIWNPGMERITGMPKATVLGQSAADLFPLDWESGARDCYQRTLQGQPVVVENGAYLIAETGRQGFFEARYSPLLGEVGEVVGGLAIMRDITERKRAQEERERALGHERVLSRICQAIVRERDLDRVADVIIEQCLTVSHIGAAAVWLADPDRRELNLFAHRHLPYALAAALGQLSYDADIAPARAADSGQIQIVDDLAVEGLVSPFLGSLTERSGLQRLVVMPLLGHGRLVGVLAYASRALSRFSPRDVDFHATVARIFAVGIENALLHRGLLQREQQVSLLLKATIDAQEEERQRVCLDVHDGVAQVLAPASYYLQALEGNPDVPDHLRGHVHTSATLVRDAMREAREVIATLRPSSLDALGLTETLRHELLEIETRTGIRMVFVSDIGRLSDEMETALYRIVHEALSNVVKHASAQTVKVHLSSEQAHVVLTVRDDGVGFDLALRDDQTLCQGVGLTSMRKRAELLGGSFSIVSHRGEGTIVKVEAPILSLRATPACSDDVLFTPFPTQAVDGDLIDVLIVDDHTVARSGLRAMLEADRQLRVVGEAVDGREALKLVGDLRPQVVLLDIRMPGVDGLEATRNIKESFPTTLVIVMTSHDDEAMVARALQAGASGYLVKSSSRALLSHTVRVAACGGTVVGTDLLHRALSTLSHYVAPVAPGGASRGKATDLTERELSVLKLLAEGCTNNEIGDALSVSEITVKRYVQAITNKLHATDRTNAVVVALRLGLIS